MVRLIARLNTGGAAAPLLMQGIHGLEGYEQVLVAGLPERNEVEMESLLHRLARPVQYIPDLRRSISPVADHRVARKLVALLHRVEPAIIETHTAKAGFVGRMAAALYNLERRRSRLPPARVAHHFHGHVFRGGYFSPLKTRTFLQLERALARYATDAIWTPCDQQARELSTDFRVGRFEQYRVIPYGLEIDALTRDQADNRAAFRAELDLSADDVAIGFIGRLEPVKNPAMFLHGAAAMLHRLAESSLRERIRLLIIGDGTLRSAMEAEADRLRIADRVRFLGTRQDRERFLAGVDIVALTSLNEGYPVALMEAMAFGQPVVGTAVGGVCELVRDRENGVLVPSGDPEALGRELSALISDPERRRAIGGAGARFVRGRHDVRHMLDRTREAYDALLGGPGGRRSGRDQ